MSELNWTRGVNVRSDGRQSSRKRRTDAGHSRFPAAVEALVQELLSKENRPSVASAHAELRKRFRGTKVPCRASIYNAFSRAIPPCFDKRSLPLSVQNALHNVRDGDVPGQQVAFAAFNYGDERALSFAAGLPWSCLYQASRMRGFRPKSFALLRAVMAHRGI